MRVVSGNVLIFIVIALPSGIEAIGIAPLTLRLFAVFFAVLSSITPPLAFAAFATALTHFAARAVNDIQVLDDLEGASIFLGPQGGGAGLD